MQVDGGIGFDPSDAVKTAQRAEDDGFDGLWCAETGHDPFLPLLLAAEHTERLELGTGIAVAFARNPMSTAVLANDLQAFSKGRFMLGLGSQIKPHIEKRYSMPWSHPAPRMREFITAMRAIWSAWHNGTKLAFRGDFYKHTLMTPFFNPGPNQYGVPKVFLAAVGQLMTEVAGEVADGLLAHGFTTARYMREVTLPALDRGLAKAGRTSAGFEISYPAMMVTGTNEAEMQTATQAVKQQLAFYCVDPRLPTGARPARMGRSVQRAQHVVQERRMGEDGGPHPRRHARRLRRHRRNRESPGQGRRALRRHGHPGELLRPVPHGARADPGAVGRVQGVLIA